MVMHARKQPTVNDGYNERKDSHLHQWLDQQSFQQPHGYGALYGDGSPSEGNHGHSAQSDSPSRSQSPRYHNKDPYLEQGKEMRGPFDHVEKNVSHYFSTSDAHRDHRNHRPDGNHHEGGSHSNHGLEKLSSANKRQGDHRDGKDHRAEQVQRSAVRVCGDWSEHISSSGKRYYFNCKSEVSQWEKPKEWNDSARPPDRGRDHHGNAKPSTSCANSSHDERGRHSSSNERFDGRNRLSYVDSSGMPEKHIQRPSDKAKSQTVDVPNSSSTSGFNVQRGNAVSRSNSSSAENSFNHLVQTAHSGYTSHPDLKRNSVYSSGSSFGEPSRRRSRLDSDSNSRPTSHHASHRSEDCVQQDLEMSPGSSSSFTQPSSSSAMQTLQELQKVLSLHIKKQQSKGVAQPSSSCTMQAQMQSQLQHLQQNILHQHQHQAQQYEHQHHQQQQLASIDLPPTHVSPHPVHSLPPSATSSHEVAEEEGSVWDQQPQQQHHHREQDEGCTSPGSVASQRLSCRSPTPVTGSCLDSPTIGTSALSTAALKSQQSITLSSSLNNYYNENLIGHVVGWQAEQLEREADRLHQESLAFSSIHCSRVSIELKRARSSVRRAEIQSTIQEQRIMVLQQQRTEIENMKPPASLLPS